MKRAAIRIVAAALLLAFVNFTFANTLFMHTHSLDNGARVTHSHPYLPSSHHSHSGSTLDNIAAMNSAAVTMRASLPAGFHFVGGNSFVSLDFADCEGTVFTASLSCSLRAPPAV